MGKMPVLRDGDVVVPDSSVICAYLERKHPKPSLFPEEPSELARALFLEEYGDTRMAEGFGEVVLERIVKPQLLGQPTDETRLAELQRQVRERWMGSTRSAGGHPLPSVLDHLEAQIPDDRDTLLPRFGIADIAIDLYVSSCVLARLDHILGHASGNGAAKPADVYADPAAGRYFLQLAFRRIRANFAALDDNDDTSLLNTAKGVIGKF